LEKGKRGQYLKAFLWFPKEKKGRTIFTMCERQTHKGKYLENKYLVCAERKNVKEKEEKIWKRKMSGCVTDRRTDKIGLEFWTQNSQYFPALFAAL